MKEKLLNFFLKEEYLKEILNGRKCDENWYSKFPILINAEKVTKIEIPYPQ